MSVIVAVIYTDRRTLILHRGDFAIFVNVINDFTVPVGFENVLGECLGVINARGEAAEIGFLVGYKNTRDFKFHARARNLRCIVIVSEGAGVDYTAVRHNEALVFGVYRIIRVPGEGVFVREKLVVVEMLYVKGGVVILRQINLSVCYFLLGRGDGILVNEVIKLGLGIDAKTGEKYIGELLLTRKNEHYLVVFVSNLTVNVVLRPDVIGVVWCLLERGGKLGDISRVICVFGFLQNRGVNARKCGD